MESLFNYGSDEDTQDKDNEELDANYDHVAMDMSSEDEEKSPQPEMKTSLPCTVESSEFSCSDSISCSSDGSHSIGNARNAENQAQKDESDRLKMRKSRTEEVRRSPNFSSSTNFKESRYPSHEIYDQRSGDDRHNSSSINRHRHRDISRSRSRSRSRSSERNQPNSDLKYNYSHRRRYSREWDCKTKYRTETGDRSSFTDERSESDHPKAGVQSSAQISIVPKFINDNPSQARESTGISIPNYYNRMAINPTKYAEKAQKRKLLWSGEKQGSTCENKAENKSNPWQDAKFSQDTDGRLTAKFKRLMGMKGTQAQVGSAASSNELIKKQEEMFNSMEMQYEVARVSTHTHRGLGLGFGVHQFPR